MRNYIKLISLTALLFTACSTPYKGYRSTKSSSATVYQYKPDFDRVLYRCIVDGKFLLKKYHLSGLLFFKQLETGTKRAIFQNEMGLAFFDMEWKADGNFELKQVIPQLDKEAVIKTLRNDMEMLLMIGAEKDSEILLQRDRGEEQVYRLNKGKGYLYYVVEDEKLIKIESANNKKKIVTINLVGKEDDTSMPVEAIFDHHKANFTISLTKI